LTFTISKKEIEKESKRPFLILKIYDKRVNYILIKHMYMILWKNIRKSTDYSKCRKKVRQKVQQK